jgi:quercetin dioxygenase-like cupin family protein
MEIIKTKVNFHDQRGDIRDIVADKLVSSIALITCETGSVRGNHYHKATTHYDYILKGSFELYTQPAEGGPIDKAIVQAGDVVYSPPMETRAYKALEYSEYLSCTHGPSRSNPDDFKKDTVQAEVPLVS